MLKIGELGTAVDQSRRISRTDPLVIVAKDKEERVDGVALAAAVRPDDARKFLAKYTKQGK